jgi:hypothetical protein
MAKQYLGQVVGRDGVSPTIDPQTYNWWAANQDGQKVDTGVLARGTNGDGISTTAVAYQLSDSGTVVPSTWQAAPPTPVPGKYLWTRTTLTFTGGISPEVSYSIGYIGTDGASASFDPSVDTYTTTPTSDTTAPDIAPTTKTYNNWLGQTWSKVVGLFSLVNSKLGASDQAVDSAKLAGTTPSATGLTLLQVDGTDSARTLIGAGTSNVAVGPGAGDALAGDTTHLPGDVALSSQNTQIIESDLALGQNKALYGEDEDQTQHVLIKHAEYSGGQQTEVGSETDALCLNYNALGWDGTPQPNGDNIPVNYKDVQGGSQVDSLAYVAKDIAPLAAVVDSLTMGGVKIGSFATYALVPQNVSGFPGAPKVSDFITVQADETQGGSRTQWYISAIDGSGNISWEFDGSFESTEPDILLTDFAGTALAASIAADSQPHSVYWAIATSFGPNANAGFGIATRTQDAISILADGGNLLYLGTADGSSASGPTWVAYATQAASDAKYTLPGGGVPNSDLAAMAASTLKGASAAGKPVDLTVQEAIALLGENTTLITNCNGTAIRAQANIKNWPDSVTLVSTTSATINPPFPARSTGICTLNSAGSGYDIVMIDRVTGRVASANVTTTGGDCVWTYSDSNSVTKIATTAVSVAGPDLQAHINAMPAYFAGDYTINLTSDNTSGLTIKGFLGKGIFYINCAGFKIGTAVEIRNVIPQIQMQNGICDSLTTRFANISYSGTTTVITGTADVGEGAQVAFNPSTSGTVAKALVRWSGHLNLFANTYITAWDTTGNMRGKITIDSNFTGTLPPYTSGYQTLDLVDLRAASPQNRALKAHKGWNAKPAEYATGEYFGGRPVFMQEFSGSMTLTALVPGSVTLIASGMAEIFQSGGTFSAASGVKYAMECTAIASARTLSSGAIVGYRSYDLAISSGALTFRLCSIDAEAETYHIWVKYTKTANTPV